MRASSLILFCFFFASFVSCTRVGSIRNEIPPLAVENAPASAPQLVVQATAVGGSPTAISSAGERRVLEIGSAVELGASVSTDSSSWIEFAIGESHASSADSVAVVRVLSSSKMSIRRLSGILEEDSPRVVELGADAGTVAVKAGKPSKRDEFFVVTPHAAVAVRGAAASFSVEARADKSVIAARQNSVSVLPKGPLLAGLLDGSGLNPVAGAVVRAALVFAPTVKAGEELGVVSGAEKSEAAYGALLIAAERAQSNGIVLEDTDDPSPFIASAGSVAEKELRSAFAEYKPTAAIASARGLSVLDSMRDPYRDPLVP